MSSSGEAAVATGELVAARFTVVDYVVFVVMLLGSVGIGVFSAIKNRGRESTHNFLLGGGEMSPYPVALSLLGGIFSAISILGEWYIANSLCYSKSLNLLIGFLYFLCLLLLLFFSVSEICILTKGRFCHFLCYLVCMTPSRKW